MDELLIMVEIGQRFHGVDLSMRRGGTDWPAPWRARAIVNKNERSEYRVQAFGYSPQQALVELKDAIARQGYVQG